MQLKLLSLYLACPTLSPFFYVKRSVFSNLFHFLWAEHSRLFILIVPTTWPVLFDESVFLSRCLFSSNETLKHWGSLGSFFFFFLFSGMKLMSIPHAVETIGFTHAGAQRLTELRLFIRLSFPCGNPSPLSDKALQTRTSPT